MALIRLLSAPPHQRPVVAESCLTPAPWTAAGQASRPSPSPRVAWVLVNVSCTKPFCWAGVGTCGSRRGGAEAGFPHTPSTRSTEIWGIILRSCKPGWGELRGGSRRHSRRREGNRGRPGPCLPHLPPGPLLQLYGREEAGLTPGDTVSANSCRQSAHQTVKCKEGGGRENL